MYDEKVFMNRLKSLRENLGMSKKDLCEELYISKDVLFNIESGRSQPSIDIVFSLCKFFNCTSDYLLGLSD